MSKRASLGGDPSSDNETAGGGETRPPHSYELGTPEGPLGAEQRMADARLRARNWTREYGADIPQVANWNWPG